MNAMAASSMQNIFSVHLGPHGTHKMIISKSGELKITNDGHTLLTDIQFTNPSCLIISKAAQQSYELLGDGVTSFVVFCTEIFGQSFSYYQNGTSIHKIIGGLKQGMRSLDGFLQQSRRPFSASTPQKLAISALKTKIGGEYADRIGGVVNRAFEHLLSPEVSGNMKMGANDKGTNHKGTNQQIGTNNNQGNQEIDINMVEIIKMQHTEKDCELVEGLVLDHAGRHAAMPEHLEDCYVLTSNLSLEYERTEINSSFLYSTTHKKGELAQKEREHSTRNATLIAQFADRMRRETGRRLLFVTDKGIDPHNLEILARHNVLGLRRAKRRNLERIMRICGGTLVSRPEQLVEGSLGHCGRVEVRRIGDESYTFLKEVPHKGSCTILVKGNNLHENSRTVTAIRAALKGLLLGHKTPFYVAGGPKLFYQASRHIGASMHTGKEGIDDVIGMKVIQAALLKIAKVLIRNSGNNVEERISEFERGEFKEFGNNDIVDSFSIIEGVIRNSLMVACTLLVVDDYIKAGKSVKKE